MGFVPSGGRPANVVGEVENNPNPAFGATESSVQPDLPGIGAMNSFRHVALCSLKTPRFLRNQFQVVKFVNGFRQIIQAGIGIVRRIYEHDAIILLVHKKGFCTNSISVWLYSAYESHEYLPLTSAFQYRPGDGALANSTTTDRGTPP